MLSMLPAVAFATVSAVAFALVFALLNAVFLFKFISSRRTDRLLRLWKVDRSSITVGFFHPYANAGGGGERVLWHSIDALISRFPNVFCAVYTGDRGVTKKQILEKVQNRFGITLPKKKINFVFLRLRKLVETGTWRRFTIAGESLGSVILGLEAFSLFVPNIYFDSMGYAFTYPLFRWLGRCNTIAYVHYPVVNTDMLGMIASGKVLYNNASAIASSPTLTRLKLVYYNLFAVVYGFVGRYADVTIVNSSWTRDHIQQIWHPRNLSVVYPPCDTNSFSSLKHHPLPDQFRVVSVAQFRPEKDHRKQLHAVRRLLDMRPGVPIVLVMIGGCRDDRDHQRVEELKSLAAQLDITDHVKFVVNAPFSELKEELALATAAIHTMWNEHFGISLVECMAAGCLMVAHRSGGPLRDIVRDWEGTQTGYLAESIEEFATCLLSVWDLASGEREAMAGAASKSVSIRFSVSSFEQNLFKCIASVLC